MGQLIMVSNEKTQVSRAKISHLGGQMALWKEDDGSLYIALDNNEYTKFYGPLTDAQVAAYELLREVDVEPDDWTVPEPLIDVSKLPARVKTKGQLRVLVSGRTSYLPLPKGTEVIVYGYSLPTGRGQPHMVSFQLIDVPGSVNSAATVDSFDLKSLAPKSSPTS
jgi:hypothetical protein